MTVDVTVWLVFCVGLVTSEIDITCSPEGEYLRYTAIQSCVCSETGDYSTLQWETPSGHVLVAGNGSITLDISFNISDPKATYICRSTGQNSTDNPTTEHQTQFAYGPLDMTFDIIPSSTSIDLCPSAMPIISVTCEVSPVNPSQPHYEIGIAGTAGTAKIKSSNYSIESISGGLLNISCTGYNRIFSDIYVTNLISLTINEPPRRIPDLTIKNSTLLNNSTLLHSSIILNRGTVILLEEGVMELACSIDGGYPEVSNVTLKCDSLFQKTASGNSHSLSHPVNWTSTNVKCECSAQHVTGCYDLKSTLYLYVTSPLKWGTHDNFQNVTSVEPGDVIHLNLSVSGFPPPSEDSVRLSTGDGPVARGRYNVTVQRSEVSNEASVWLELKPLSDDDFNNYTLVVSNLVNQTLEISFRVMRAVPATEEVNNIALIAGIAIPVSIIFIVAVIISVVWVVRVQYKTDEEEGPELDISAPIGVEVISSEMPSLDLNAFSSRHQAVSNEYGDGPGVGMGEQADSGSVEVNGVRPISDVIDDGEDQGPHQMLARVAGGKRNPGHDKQVVQTVGSGRPGQGLFSGPSSQRTGSGRTGQMSNKRPTNGDYDNFNINNRSLERRKEDVRQKPSEDVINDDTEDGNTASIKDVIPGVITKELLGRGARPAAYENVGTIPMGKGDPPLPMTSRDSDKGELDDDMNPHELRLDGDQGLKETGLGDTTPLKLILSDARDGYVNVDYTTDDLPSIPLTISPDRFSAVANCPRYN